MFSAKLFDGSLFQDPSPLCSDFIAQAVSIFVSSLHRPFLISHLIHPDSGEQVPLHDTLSTDTVYYLFFDYHTVRPWMKEEFINIEAISELPQAIRHLEKHKDKIDYKRLSKNHAAGHLLWEKRDDPECFDWPYLCKNPADQVIDLMERYPEYVHWPAACVNENPGIIRFLERNLSRIHWNCLSRNPVTLPLLLKYPQNISWADFSANPAAIPYLCEHPDRINLHELCSNPNGMDLIIERLDQMMPVDWRIVSRANHPYIDQLLEKVHGKEDIKEYLCWWSLSKNPSAIRYLIKYNLPINHSVFVNPHPEIISFVFLKSMIPFDLDRNDELLRNPSAIKYIETEHILDYIIEQNKSSFWKHLSHNPAIYCPPL